MLIFLRLNLLCLGYIINSTLCTIGTGLGLSHITNMDTLLGAYHINFNYEFSCSIFASIYIIVIWNPRQQKDTTRNDMRKDTFCVYSIAQRWHLRVVGLDAEVMWMPGVVRKRVLFLCMLRHDYLYASKKYI